MCASPLLHAKFHPQLKLIRYVVQSKMCDSLLAVHSAAAAAAAAATVTG